jgi:MFS family permease
VLLCGGIALTIALGTRHSFGLFLQPMTLDHGWGRQTFAFAIALQNLVYGAAGPFTGMIADKFGAGRVMVTGAVLYAAGLALMSLARTGLELDIAAGLLIGLALSCCGFSIIYGVVARTFPAERRSTALGIAGAAGSFGQFAMLPIGQALISNLGWQQALLVLAVTVALVAPLAVAMVEKRKPDGAGAARQSVGEALREAFSHSGYVLLCIGYTVCGFQLMFISVHFPAYLMDQHMSPETGMTALALIGLFNVFGSFVWGWLGGRYTKKYLLSLLYFTRAIAIAIFIAVPITPGAVFVFASVIGFLWLGTAPITNAMIAHMFGVRYMSTLGASAFLFHQIGSFAGAALGGYLFDATQSYDVMWTLTIAMGVLAALINWPIDERQVVRAPARNPA